MVNWREVVTDDTIRAVLAERGREFAEARADVETFGAALGVEIRAAHDAGWSERRIAATAGVARETVRKALGKEKG